MQSGINIIEFKERLSKNTSIGNPNINGTPLAVFNFFDTSNKKFYGRINDNSFEITRHSTFRLIPYKIKGVMIANKDSTTSIEYLIKPIWFGYLWIRILPTLFVLFVLSGIIANPAHIFPLGIFGLLITLMCLINLYIISRRLKNFEIDFKKTFEII